MPCMSGAVLISYSAARLPSQLRYSRQPHADCHMLPAWPGWSAIAASSREHCKQFQTMTAVHDSGRGGQASLLSTPGHASTASKDQYIEQLCQRCKASSCASSPSG
jgi:hypothetical protein